MKNATITVNEKQLEKLNNFYQQYCLEVSKPYISFVALHNHNQITAFASGKIIVQGEAVDQELLTIKTILGVKNYPAVGNDVVGSSDVFGPIVVCSCYTDAADLEFLESLNVNVKQTLTTKRIIEIGPQIAKRLTHSITILTPPKYNSLTENGYSMNKIKALLLNHMIIKTTAKLEGKIPVIVEQFCLPTHYFNHLKDETFVYRNIEFHHNAYDVHLSVIAAHIIARYAYIVKMHQLSKQLSIHLKLGQSKEIDEQLKEIYQKYGAKTILETAKCNFKNVTRCNFTL